MKDPKDKKPRRSSQRPDKPRGGFVKRGKVWRSDRAQETARGRERPRERPRERLRERPRERPREHPRERRERPRDGGQAKSARPRQVSKGPNEEDLLQNRALAATGPGGYARFADIPAHKSGRSLRSELYKLANELPEEERLNLSARIKHAATTVTASLAAGFGEGTFRSGITRALESRGALQALLDLLDQVGEQEMAEADRLSGIQKAAEQTIDLVNEYLGRLAREREKNSC